MEDGCVRGMRCCVRGGILGAAAFQLVWGSRKRGIVITFDAI